MAKDIIHDAVKSALVKDGWTITHDPFRVQYEEFELFADLGAERKVAPDQIEHRIVVEVKSFVGLSFVTELQKAIGQYTIYRRLIQRTSHNYEIFLALGDNIYQTLFQQKAVQLIIQEEHIALLIVDTIQERVVEWIK